MWQNSKTQIVTKIKKKLWQNSKTQIATKLETQELQLWWIKKKIVTKLEKLNCGQTQKLQLCKTKKLKLWQLKNSNCDSNKNDSSDDNFLVKKTPQHLDNRPTLRAAFHNSCNVFYLHLMNPPPPRPLRTFIDINIFLNFYLPFSCFFLNYG